MANFKTVKVTCTLANTAYNVATGTTGAPTSTSHTNAGRGLLVNVQHATAVATVGASDVVTNGGVRFTGENVTHSYPAMPNASAYRLEDVWVSSSVAGAVVVFQIVKHI